MTGMTQARMLTSRRGECTLRTRLWLWLFTLVFAGFVLHATVCACAVVHPHKGSTKPCITQCHATKKQSIITQQAARPDIVHPALRLLLTPQLPLPRITSALPRFAPENADPLLARGPPPGSISSNTPGSR